MDEGAEAVTDAKERDALRVQGARIQRQSLLVAVLLTAVAMAVPAAG